MEFRATALAGVWEVHPTRHVDERGFFARTWDPVAFAAQGLETRVAECSVSYNQRRGTLRGLHFQRSPYAEAKLVRCTRGAIFDVAVDLRPASPTFRAWHAAELTADNHAMLYVPEGCAHGFLTLADDTEVAYQISVPYAPEAGAGVRWDDPAFGVRWPFAPVVVAARDAAYADFAS
ncbi:MAG: rfbC [Cyanobacteria bacterium RYN_339]|nr:rfbC [Cyanobacteria bacterium RYN_339]